MPKPKPRAKSKLKPAEEFEEFEEFESEDNAPLIGLNKVDIIRYKHVKGLVQEIQDLAKQGGIIDADEKTGITFLNPDHPKFKILMDLKLRDPETT